MFLSNESDDSSCDCRRAVGVGVAGDNFDNFVPHNVKMMTKVQLDKVERVIKGKAALGLKKFNDFKQKVKAEEMDMKINDSNDMKVSKEVQGGWILTKVCHIVILSYHFNVIMSCHTNLLIFSRIKWNISNQNHMNIMHLLVQYLNCSSFKGNNNRFNCTIN